jgi:hypothetical protein
MIWTRTDTWLRQDYIHRAFLECRARAIRNDYFTGAEDRALVQEGTGAFTIEQAIGWANRRWILS